MASQLARASSAGILGTVDTHSDPQKLPDGGGLPPFVSPSGGGQAPRAASEPLDPALARDLAEERAAIMEHDGGLSWAKAEALAGIAPSRLIWCDLCCDSVPANPWPAPDATCPHGCFDT